MLPPVGRCPSGGGNDGAKMEKGTVVGVADAVVVVFFLLFFTGARTLCFCVGDSGIAEGSGTRLVLTMSAKDLPEEDHAMNVTTKQIEMPFFLNGMKN